MLISITKDKYPNLYNALDNAAFKDAAEMQLDAAIEIAAPYNIQVQRLASIYLNRLQKTDVELEVDANFKLELNEEQLQKLIKYLNHNTSLLSTPNLKVFTKLNGGIILFIGAVNLIFTVTPLLNLYFLSSLTIILLNTITRLFKSGFKFINTEQKFDANKISRDLIKVLLESRDAQEIKTNNDIKTFLIKNKAELKAAIVIEKKAWYEGNNPIQQLLTTIQDISNSCIALAILATSSSLLLTCFGGLLIVFSVISLIGIALYQYRLATVEDERLEFVDSLKTSKNDLEEARSSSFVQQTEDQSSQSSQFQQTLVSQ